MRKSILSILFRFGGAVSKFVLFLYLAKVMSVSDVGLLALCFSSIALAVQFVGLEIHYYNSRLIASLSSKDSAALFKSQILFHLSMYPVIFIIFFLIFYFFNFGLEISLLLAFLILSEHLGQEFIRYLQFRFKANIGALVIFLRSGAWSFMIIGIAEYFQSVPGVNDVIFVWLIFSLISLVVAILSVREEIFSVEVVFCESITYSLRSVFLSLPFFASTALFALSQHSDRFIINSYFNRDFVGIYFFYFSMSAVVQMMATFGVGVFLGPKVIKLFYKKKYRAYTRVRNRLWLLSGLFGIFAIAVSLLLINPLLLFVNKISYSEYKFIFYFLLMGGFMQIFSDLIGFELYLRGLDREILLSVAFGIFVGLVAQLFLIRNFGLLGAGFSACITPLILGFNRWLFLRRAVRLDPKIIYKPKILKW